MHSRNYFRFDKASGKPGTIAVVDILFLEVLKQRSGKKAAILWTRIVGAGLKETIFFSTDTMFKWFTRQNRYGVNYSADGLSNKLQAFPTKRQIPYTYMLLPHKGKLAQFWFIRTGEIW